MRVILFFLNLEFIILLKTRKKTFIVKTDEFDQNFFLSSSFFLLNFDSDNRIPNDIYHKAKL